MTSVLTWNVNSLKVRMEFLRHWLESARPDVVLLQETKLRDEEFPYQEILSFGYHAVHRGISQWNGVAILAREPIELLGDVDVEVTFDGVREARCIAARVAECNVVSVYVPNGRALDHPHFAYKLAWLDGLRNVLEQLGPHRLIVGGDFNIAPTDLDVWDPTAMQEMTHVTPLEREALQRIGALGVVDLVRAAHPEDPQFSWWDYRGGAFHRGHGLRIDLLLASSDLADRMRDARTIRDARKQLKTGEKPSDHAPVFAEFEEERAR
jgi:exodeoxyribonuclease-3